MNFKIVTDSSADILTLSDVPYESVPLKIITDEKEYVDDPSLDVVGMLTDLKSYKGKSRTSCPSSGEYLAAFGDSENIFVITISSNLSGSFNAANVAANTYLADHPDRRVYIIDSLSTGPENALIIHKLCEYIERGLSFDEIVNKIKIS